MHSVQEFIVEIGENCCAADFQQTFKTKNYSLFQSFQKNNSTIFLMALFFLLAFFASFSHVESLIAAFAKNSESPVPAADLSLQSTAAGLTSTALASLILNSPNGLQFRRLVGLDQPSAGNPALYPALALDADGDGIVDQFLLQKNSPPLVDDALLSALLPPNGYNTNVNQRVLGRQLNGQPVKVYQHQRTLHLPTAENHYVQRSIGPAIETDVVKGIPVGTLEEKDLKNIRDYGANARFLRKKRQANIDEEGDGGDDDGDGDFA